jgi:hypothetical protein
VLLVPPEFGSTGILYESIDLGIYRELVYRFVDDAVDFIEQLQLDLLDEEIWNHLRMVGLMLTT